VLPTNNVSIVQASGGHASPTIYVRDPGAGRLWNWTAGLAAWQEITYAGPSGPMFASAFFVDPYRPQTLYIVDSRNGAIYRSDNGGANVVRDDALTMAVTENGAFKVPLDDSFYDTEGIVNDMVFDPDDPARRFVVAYTGAYFTVDGARWSGMMSTTALPQHTQMAALDTVSDACNHALYIATGGRGMLRLKPLPVAMRDTNVTAITGRRVVGPLTSWQTPNGPYLVEHLAARDANGHLIVFWWSPQHDWQAVDITAITGHTIATGVTSWQTPNGPENVEHLAACDATGRLLVFYWAPSHDWRVVDVTAISGVRVIGTPTSWQTHDGTLLTEHLAAQSPAGELIEFSWSPAHDWQAVNVTAITRLRLGGAPTSWLTPNGPLVVTHLAAAGADGRLLVFYTSPGHNWQAVDVTARTGVFVHGDVASWQVNKCRPVNFEHLAATDASGLLLFFSWSP
jgi:hypothetical protein